MKYLKILETKVSSPCFPVEFTVPSSIVRLRDPVGRPNRVCSKVGAARELCAVGTSNKKARKARLLAVTKDDTRSTVRRLVRHWEK